METINITKKRFDSLKQYQLPNYVYNTEGTLYVLPLKNRWNTQIKLLKRLYLNSGAVFGNKLQTINSLIDNKDEIDVNEIVFPEKIATVGSEIVGFIMPLINSINLKTALMDDHISNERKIKYLKQIGNILEKMKLVREYTSINEFYLNDLHESNFIVTTDTDDIRVIDVDSCKINGNQIFTSKYLSSKSFINQIYKYQKNNAFSYPYAYSESGIKYRKYSGTYHKYSTNIEGSFIPDENTDLYCYMIVILNFLYGEDTSRFTFEEFYDYLSYLDKIGVSKEFIDIAEKLVDGSPNENPYLLLDSLIPFIGRSNHYTYKYVMKKSSKQFR